MPITRHGPVINFDTEKPLIMRAPNQRFTRSQARRLLKSHGIKSDPNSSMDHLYYLMSMHNIQPQMVPPGKMGKDEIKKPKLVVNNEFPNNVPKLRKMCKEKGVKFKREDKKETLIQRLREHGKNSA